jgi:tetratricopeptide (TPR) repeat protein
LAIGLVLGLAFAVGGLLLVSESRRLTGGGVAVVALSPEELEKLRQRSLDKEAAFEQARLSRPQLTEAEIQLLAEALQAQEDYITARGALGKDNGRLDALRRRYHTLRAERLRARSDQEEDAALAAAATDVDAAMAGIRRAIALEQEIVQQWVYSSLGEPGRLARLDTRLRRLESEPVWRLSREQEAAAVKLATAGDHVGAAAKYDEALATENRFLERFRDVRATEFDRVDRLTIARDTERSAPAAAEVDALVRQAGGLERTGRWEEAIPVWKQALAKFNDLLAQHPRSALADRERERELVRRGQVAIAHPRIAAIEGQAVTMRGLLRAREVTAALAAAAAAGTELQRLNEQYPGVFPPEDPLRQELEFVVERQATIAALLPSFDRQLAPLPGGAPARLLTREVPQGLYAALMGVNPSAQVREGHPVDSVAYADAEAFCRRLGWVLGARVRLPALAELARAAGDVTRAPGARQAWTFENSDGINPRPVATSEANAAGFFDLLGNVEEWTLAPAGAEEAVIAGGSVGWLAVPGFPARTVPKREKSRILGFRIVVE